jgi:peroxiredoxin
MIDKKKAAGAPDFEQRDSTGKNIRLAEYKGKSNIVLVLNRGFG